jgi:gluconate 5-dehydrogenase
LTGLPAQVLRDLLETSLVSAWHLCREVAHTKRAQCRGRIINVTSIAGPMPAPTTRPTPPARAAWKP